MPVHEAKLAGIIFVPSLDLADDPDISGNIRFFTHREEGHELARHRRVSREIIFHANMDLLYERTLRDFPNTFQAGSTECCSVEAFLR